MKRGENNVWGSLQERVRKKWKRSVWKKFGKYVHDVCREVDEARLWCEGLWDNIMLQN